METLTLILLGVAGILLHIIMKFRDQVTKYPKTQGQTFKQRLLKVWGAFDVLGNLMYALFALIVVIICVSIREQLVTIQMPITWLTIIGIGYASDSFIKNIKPETK